MKQMAWLNKGGCECSKSAEFKILHLRVNGGAWLPYTDLPQYAAKDYMDDGSKGWATYQKLKTQDWELVPTAIAEQLLRC
jgi:hypothetical protein